MKAIHIITGALFELAIAAHGQVSNPLRSRYQL